MSRLPQPGDAVKATVLLNDRLEAAVGATEEDVIVRTGPVTLDETGLHGPGVPSLLAVYGDLFDITETLDDAGFAGMLIAHEKDVQAGNDALDSALVAVALQSIAFGVLMERNRWERGAADRSVLLSAAKFALTVLESDHTEVGAAHGEDACWLCSAESHLRQAVAAAEASS